jgi:hypothetical protein
MKRLERGDWPAPATVSGLYGTWAAALLDAFDDEMKERVPGNVARTSASVAEGGAQALSDARRLSASSATAAELPIDVEVTLSPG